MTYKLIIKTEAELDIAHALEWYASQKSGLELDFLNAIEETLAVIERTPKLFQLRYRNIRVVFTKRFPYGIHYTIEKNQVFVHAVLNTSRASKM